MAKRYFTLEEAQGLVLWLSEVFEALAPLRDRVRELYPEIEELEERMRSNGGADSSGRLDQRRRDLATASADIEEQVQAIVDRGIEIKSVDQGLVDFPCLRDGREVYLCWKEGESDIGSWHETDAGFAGRQPLESF